MHPPRVVPRSLVVALAVTTVPVALAPAVSVLISVLGVHVTAAVATGILAVSLLGGISLGLRLHRELPSPPTGVSERRTAWALLPVTLVASAVLALTWSRPVLDWDGLYYHVPAIQGWFHAGGVHWIENSTDVPFVNGYPMAMEVLGYLGVLIFGHDRWLDAWNVVLWPTAVAGLALTARLWGARSLWPAVAGASFLLVPAWMLGSTIAYVDAGFAAAMAAFVAATVWRLQRNDHLASALLWGAAGGLAAAAKGTGLVLAVFGGGLLLVDLALRPARQRKSAVRALVLGVAVLVAIGGVWPARSLVHSGNPIHPVELKIGAKVVGEGVDAHVTANHSMPERLRDLPAPMRPVAVWARPFMPVDRYDQAEGLGPLWTLGALPGLLFVLWTGRRRLDIVGPIALVALGLAAQPGPWWARLSLWITAVGLPAFAVLASHLTNRRLPRPRRLAGAVAVGFVLLSAGWITGGSLLREQRRPHAADAFTQYFSELVAHPAWSEFLDAPRVARTSWGRFGTLMGGALASPIGARELVHVQEPQDVPSDVDWWIWDLGATEASPEDLASWEIVDRPRSGFVLLHRIEDSHGGSPGDGFTATR